MSKAKPLGKGLSALIQKKEESPAVQQPLAKGERVHELALEEVRVNPDQPRRDFDGEALEELTASVREQGVLQPILVFGEHGGYTIIAGERRYRASVRAGRKTIPAIVREKPASAELLQLALIENIQREDLNPLDLASGYRSLIEEYGMTQEELAAVVGKKRATVANTLRLVKLPAVIKVSLKSGEISMGHARALLGVVSDDEKVQLWQQCVRKHLSVRQLEDLVQRSKQEQTGAKPRVVKPFDILEAEDRIRDSLGTRVQISPNRNRGSISISYDSKEELDRLLETLTSMDQ